MQNPHDVLKVFLETKSAPKGRENYANKIELEDTGLPLQKEFLKKLEEIVIFKEENPLTNYKLIEKIGEGGFAKVYKVLNLATNEVCALKLIDPQNSAEK